MDPIGLPPEPKDGIASDLYMPDKTDNSVQLFKRGIEQDCQSLLQQVQQVGQSRANDDYTRTEMVLFYAKKIMENAEMMHNFSEQQRAHLPGNSARLGSLEAWTRLSKSAGK